VLLLALSLNLIWLFITDGLLAAEHEIGFGLIIILELELCNYFCRF
jgi:hypothetical protein